MEVKHEGLSPRVLRVPPRDLASRHADCTIFSTQAVEGILCDSATAEAPSAGIRPHEESPWYLIAMPCNPLQPEATLRVIAALPDTWSKRSRSMPRAGALAGIAVRGSLVCVHMAPRGTGESFTDQSAF